MNMNFLNVPCRPRNVAANNNAVYSVQSQSALDGGMSAQQQFQAPVLSVNDSELPYCDDFFGQVIYWAKQNPVIALGIAGLAIYFLFKK